MKIDIWIVAIEHRHGMDLTAVTSEEKAFDIVRTYVDEWWEHEMTKGRKKTKPRDTILMVRDYFRIVDDESFIIEKTELELEPNYG